MPRSLPPARETPIESGILSRLGRGARAFLDIVGGKQWLGPGEPIPPVAPPGVQVRQLDYPVGYDYTIQPRSYKPVSFQQLQALADNYELLRIAIETRKHQIARLPWHIHVKRQPEMTAREGQANERSDNRIQKLTALFRRPDRERSFRNWVSQILENVLVLDAVALYPRFGVHRRMVREALGSALPVKRKRPQRACPKLGSVKEFIDAILEADRRAPRKQRHTAHRIWQRLRAERSNCPVAESSVRRYVGRRKRELGLGTGETFVPQSYAWGQEAQVNWYEAEAESEGERCTPQVFSLRSMASGGAFHRGYRRAPQQFSGAAHSAGNSLSMWTEEWGAIVIVNRKFPSF